MSEAKCTPGPWGASADRICGGLRIRIRAQERPLGQAKTLYAPIVAEVASDWGISDDEAEANARLIAAAPDLLDVVRDVVRMTESADVHEVDLSNFVASARAAIAKAESRS